MDVYVHSFHSMLEGVDSQQFQTTLGDVRLQSSPEDVGS
jgi:hypothetical protein